MSVEVGEEGDSLPGRSGRVWVALREVDRVFGFEEGRGNEGGAGTLVPTTVPVPVGTLVTGADTDLVPVLVLDLVVDKVENGALRVSDREGREAVVSGSEGVPATGMGAKGSPPARSSRNGVADAGGERRQMSASL